MNLPPGANPQDPNVGILYHAAIAQWIFENNKHKRDFFIEESFPMEWTYAYAVPNGLSYRLNKEPLATLPPEVVEQDFKYWNAYVDRLLGDKNFHEDFDAKRSFSKLRNSTGNIYRARRMWPEAERAYRQALQLHPNNMESLVAISDILRAQKRWDEMAEIWDQAIKGDPNNRSVGKARARVTRLREADREITSLQSELTANPQNPEVVSALLRLYMETGQTDLVRQQLEQSASAFGDNPEFLKFAVDFCGSNGQWQPGLDFARKLSLAATNDPGVLLALARFEFANRQMPQFLDAARKAVQLGGMQAKAALANDPLYGMVRGKTEFQQLLQ
jgi:tetratricopeptide (TPR) repeat protein